MSDERKRTVLRLVATHQYAKDQYWTPLKEKQVADHISQGLPIPDSTGGWFNPSAVVWWWDADLYEDWLAERRDRQDRQERAEREDEVRRGIRETVDGPQIGSPAWNEQHPVKSVFGLKRR